MQPATLHHPTPAVKPQPCTCCAYPFPHAVGSGSCAAEYAGQWTNADTCEPGQGAPCPTCEAMLSTDHLAYCLDDGRTYGSREAWA